MGDGLSVTSLDASYSYIFCMYTHTVQYEQPIASCTIPTQPSPTLNSSDRSLPATHLPNPLNIHTYIHPLHTCTYT